MGLNFSKNLFFFGLWGPGIDFRTPWKNFSLRPCSEVIEFLKIQHKKEQKAAITDLNFQNRLAFLADMFCHLNELNCKLQGVHSNLLGQRDKIAALSQSLNIGGSGVAFPTLEKMIERNGFRDVV